MTQMVETRTTAAGVGGTRSSGLWAAWGVAAGVLGIAAHLLSDPQGSFTQAQRMEGDAIIGELARVGYHFGAVTGFLAVACLLVAAAGWRRWSEQVPDHLAARVVAPALVSAAGAMTVGYGFKGMLSIYLDGGINGGEYPAEALYTYFVINDLVAYFAWLGVIVAAAAVAVVSLRARLLPRWMGVFSVLVVLPVLGMLLAFGLTGFAGVPGPLWLVVVSAGMLKGGRTTAT